MPKKPAVPVLQVLFEPWPDPDEEPWNRDSYEAFAGRYWIDALKMDGTFRDKGYRATVTGCTTCRRNAVDPRVHVPNINDLKAEGPRRKCPTWKTVEAIVKNFGGWRRVHYVELPANERLAYQPIPQRRRVIEACPACDGTGYAGWDTDMKNFVKCDAGCASYNYQGRGEVQITYEGPVRVDRLALSESQRRMRV